MKKLSILKEQLAAGAYEQRLCRLYCCGPVQAAAHAARYAAVLDGLDATFGPHAEAALFSAPGRTEIGGNHTDHQRGRVLAGSVNIDMIAAVAENGCGELRVQSEGYDLCVIPLADLEKKPAEENTTMALLRGTCAAFVQRGAKLTGLDVYVASNVPKGSGVSSSAAFEVLIGTILNELFMGDAKVSAIEIAQIGQWAENVYFGKPCGLMDQMASSVGNIITIDFADKDHPAVTPVAVDFAKAGLALCILDSGADHADLTDEYAAIPADCCAVAAVCGGKVLREVPFADFLANVPACRKACGDRIGDGGEDRRDGARGGVVAGLRHRGGDADHHVHLRAGKLRGDLLGDAHVRLRVLQVDLEVLAFNEARLREALDKALVAVVQRAVLRELADAHGVGFRKGDGGGKDQGDADDDGNDALHNVFLPDVLLSRLENSDQSWMKRRDQENKNASYSLRNMRRKILPWCHSVWPFGPLYPVPTYGAA